MITAADFLPAICAAPDDDTPRLVFADWLEEHATSTLCQACCALPEWADPGLKARVDELMNGGPLGDGVGPGNTARRVREEFGRACTGDGIHALWQRGKPWYIKECRTCHGSGRVSDGRTERAEFIRVQIELAKPQTGEPWCFHDLTMPDHCPRCRLRRRERELLHANVDWCDEVWPVPNHHWHPVEVGFLSADADVELGFRRGFTELLACAAKDWLAHEQTILACQPIREVTLTTRLYQAVTTRWVRDEMHVHFAGDQDPVVLGSGELAALGSYAAQLRRATLVWLAERWPGIHFRLTGQ